jgi:Mn2+/Fe2+ NRAMP family transporter
MGAFVNGRATRIVAICATVLVLTLNAVLIYQTLAAV